MGTNDQAHPKQEQVISQLINDESVWMEKALSSIMDYYREVYPDYKNLDGKLAELMMKL